MQLRPIVGRAQVLCATTGEVKSGWCVLAANVGEQCVVERHAVYFNDSIKTLQVTPDRSVHRLLHQVRRIHAQHHRRVPAGGALSHRSEALQLVDLVRHRHLGFAGFTLGSQSLLPTWLLQVVSARQDGCPG